MKTEINSKRLEPLDRTRWGNLVKNQNRFAVWTSFLFAFCNDCDWTHEYDRGEEFRPAIDLETDD